MKNPLKYAAFLLLVNQGKFGFCSLGKCWKARKKAYETLVSASRKNRNGYNIISFWFQGLRLKVMEHVAYYIWKTGKWPRKGMQINHKDLDRNNGKISNLEIVTQSKNMRHAHEMRKKGIKGGKR